MKNLSCKHFFEPEEVFRTNSSNRSSLFSSTSGGRTPSSSSSSASSCSSHSRFQIKRSVSLDFRHMSSLNKQKSMKRDCGRKCTYNPTLEMCIFLVCLFVLVFWGKVFAIVTCTSTWLFFAPGQRSHQLRGVDSSDVIDSEEYKKRVIMEGLLERNRSSRVLLQLWVSSGGQGRFGKNPFCKI